MIMMISNVNNFGSPNYGYGTSFRGATTDGMAPEQTGFTPAPEQTTSTDNSNSSTSTQAPKKRPINWLAWGALGAGALAFTLGVGHHNFGWFKKAAQEGASKVDQFIKAAEGDVEVDQWVDLDG